MFVFIIFFLIIPAVFPQSYNYNITVDCNIQQGNVFHFWSECIGSDHAYAVLNSSLQFAYNLVSQDLKIRRVRFHGILNDDVGVYHWDGVNAPTYDWTKFDQIMDFIVGCGYKPILEISFMPGDLSRNKVNSGFWWFGVHGYIDPPKDWNRWRDLIYEVVKHCQNRYGAQEIESWYWELWNEPDGAFWSGTQQEFFTLYDRFVEGATSANPNVKLGGFGATWVGSDMMRAFMNYCVNNNRKLDFISYHVYSSVSGPTVNSFAIVHGHRSAIQELRSRGLNIKAFCTEYNTNYAGAGGGEEDNQVSMDTNFNAVYLAKVQKIILDDYTEGLYPFPDALSYWEISDVFDESDLPYVRGYPPYFSIYGIITRYCIKKAVYNGFKVLTMMGDKRLSLTGGVIENDYEENDGVNGFATFDSTHSIVSVLLYNYYHVVKTTGTDIINLVVSNIPFTPGKIKVEHYLIDETHSNSYNVWLNQGKPANPTPQQWEQIRQNQDLFLYETSIIDLSSRTYSKTFPTKRQSVNFIQIKPYSQSANNPPLAPSDLKCDGLVNPKGISNTNPTLSWKFNDIDTGDNQSSYRLLVATSISVLSENNGNIWDKTGTTETSVVYAGTPLLKGLTYYWKVMTWDIQGSSGPYSNIANFSLQQETTSYPENPFVYINTSTLIFDDVKIGERKTLGFEIINVGQGILSGNISSDTSWIEVSPEIFTGNKVYVNVIVDNEVLGAREGQYRGVVNVITNGGNGFVEVILNATCILSRPNPYNPLKSKLKFFGSGIVPGKTKIEIWTVTGEKIKEVLSDTLEWDGRDSSGKLVSPGIYIYAYNSKKEKGAGKITVIYK